MKNKYAPEPWIARGLDVFSNEQSGYVCTVSGYLENARRIVACVNACAGISNEALEEWGNPAGPGMWGRAASTLQSQRDELLAALTHAATDYIDQNGSVPSWWTDKIRQMVKDSTRS